MIFTVERTSGGEHATCLEANNAGYTGPNQVLMGCRGKNIDIGNQVSGILTAPRDETQRLSTLRLLVIDDTTSTDEFMGMGMVNI